MKKSRLILSMFTVFMLAIGCNNNGPDDDNARTSFIQGETVFILSEGVFQNGNGSVAHYNKSTDSLEKNVFQKVNGDNPGDIVQAMSIINGKGYIVVNNSQKIEVVGLDSLLRKGMISGFVSPRSIHHVGGNKAYVTELFGDSVAVVDLTTEMITGRFRITGWTEEMVQNQEYVFIGNNGDENVYVVDPQEDSVVNTISLTAGSKYMVFDSDQDLWVLCQGNSVDNIPSHLYEIDPSNFSIINDFSFAASSASELEIDATGTKLYFLNGGVSEMSTSATQLPSSNLVPGNGRALYALAVHQSNGEIYLGDAGNFSDPGMVYRYDSNGGIIDSFEVGISPGYFQFY